MKAIRIYIVDDEPMAITYLKFLLDQIRAECQVVGEATNSRKALGEILQLKPDMVFLDINMPVMDGLTLAEEILKRNAMKIFLLTSYRDFDFVKKGIRIGVTDYILKNDLTESFLESLLTKTAQELSVERREQFRVLEYNVRHFLMDSAVREKNSNIYKHKPLQRYGLIGVFLKDGIHLKHQKSNNRFHLDCFELYDLSCEKGIECSAFAQVSEQEIFGVYFIHEEAADGQLLLGKQAERIMNYLEQKEIAAQCIVSLTGKQFMDLPERYRELHRLKDYLYRENEKNILLQQDLDKGVDNENQDKIRELRKKLDVQFGEDRQEEFRDTLLEYLRVCQVQQNVWEFAETLKMIFRMLQEIRKKNTDFPETFLVPESFSEPEEAKNVILELLESSFKQNEQEEPYSPYVKKALEYIREHYQQDLAMPDLAEAVGISEGHLRRLFKQELQMKMVDYLMDYRLECAKTLMKKGNTSVGEVWKQTGFTSAQYFSYVFKKKEGVLPKDYIKGKMIS
ncbi:MAG: response regulator [Eubacteriales bacterium]|nr:response regulator [Eubacteriales bacterium]